MLGYPHLEMHDSQPCGYVHTSVTCCRRTSLHARIPNLCEVCADNCTQGTQCSEPKARSMKSLAATASPVDRVKIDGEMEFKPGSWRKWLSRTWTRARTRQSMKQAAATDNKYCNVAHDAVKFYAIALVARSKMILRAEDCWPCRLPLTATCRQPWAWCRLPQPAVAVPDQSYSWDEISGF